MELNIKDDTSIDKIEQFINTSVNNKLKRVYINGVNQEILNELIFLVNKKGYTISKNLFNSDNYIIELK